MWVRCQDRISLNKIENIWVQDRSNAIVILSSINKSENWLLGNYSTKEQALQVLDEIQERINEGCPYVYQMPENEAEANQVTKSMIEEE